MASEPTVTCGKCGRSAAVVPDGRGFPPDIAKRKLRKLCRADGCDGEPTYRAGFLAGSSPAGAAVLAARLREAREYLGFGLADVATRMQRDQSWVDDIEHGRCRLSGEELRKLSRLYRRPIAWLCGEFGFAPSPGLLCKTGNLTEGDREAVLDFAEFLQCSAALKAEAESAGKDSGDG